MHVKYSVHLFNILISGSSLLPKCQKKVMLGQW